MSNDVPINQSNPKEESTPFNIPNGFYNTKFALIILIALMVLMGINLYGQFFYGEQAVPSKAWIYLGLYIVEILFWGIGLQLWARVRIAGYYWVFALAHLSFIFAIFELVTNPSGRLLNVVKALCIFLFLLVNIWSKEVFFFFKKTNGKCPNCQKVGCGEPKKNKKWTCPACNHTFIWKIIEA